LEKNDLKEPNPNKRKSRIARTEDVVRTRGELDVSKILPIMAPRPTIADIEEASMWLGGDRDVSGPGRPLKGVASQIVTILTADEDDEPPRSGCQRSASRTFSVEAQAAT
jgi:hypothetical protein